MVEQKKRFALFLATLDSDFVKKAYGGYFHVFVSSFGDEGEQWDLFRVIDGEFPDEKDLDKYDSFVISGSSHDAFGDADWIVKLCSVCQKLDEMKKKVLGICFGHQIIARVKGGKIGRVRKGSDLGLRSIAIAKDNAKLCRYFEGEVSASLARVKGGKIGRARKGSDLGLRSIAIAKDNAKLCRYFEGEVSASLAIIKCPPPPASSSSSSSSFLSCSSFFFFMYLRHAACMKMAAQVLHCCE